MTGLSQQVSFDHETPRSWRKMEAIVSQASDAARTTYCSILHNLLSVSVHHKLCGGGGFQPLHKSIHALYLDAYARGKSQSDVDKSILAHLTCHTCREKLMIEFTYLHEITDTWTNSSN
ncbi:hypothetical protein Naga_100173g8 [Nannochloropsis gaditana]|uniref:Uncharacterized protein n=1 Tax=Nannochloropsis gaditana TaxID=72520 RepID=W7UAU8_9STRA|nr:hypothetical protein Naga_100173g8 [Nannochloropsis gaditana]